MAQAFDPYGIQPNWQGQGNDVVTAWQRALANLNYQKGNTLAKYGFNNEGDLTGSTTTNPDGTQRSATMAGGLAGVTNFNEFAGKDNKSGYGGFRDELTAEANALTAADNGPSRGFSGGLSNQARNAAQQAVARSQNQFTQGYNQFAGGVNLAGQNATADTNQQFGTILQNQNDWGANEAAWQSTIPAYTAGVSGGGSTPLGATAAPRQLSPQARQMASSLGYGTVKNPTNLHPVTFKGTAKPATPTPRGGHAL